MKMSGLKKREKGIVISVNHSNKSLRKRMLDMGITKGVEVIIKKVAPFGDPVCIELRGYELCLRKSDLVDVEVSKL